MADSISFRLLEDADAPAASRLIEEVFSQDIAPVYSPEGAREFLAYADSGGLAERAHQGHVTLLACDFEEIVAVAEMRENSHLAMFFVAKRWQRRGVGRELLRRAVEICRHDRPGLVAISVNASPNALGAYERLGFVAEGPEMTLNGIRFTPMTLDLRRWGPLSTSSSYVAARPPRPRS
jgi:GNAT superfamily N-acetyltransferase